MECHPSCQPCKSCYLRDWYLRSSTTSDSTDDLLWNHLIGSSSAAAPIACHVSDLRSPAWSVGAAARTGHFLCIVAGMSDAGEDQRLLTLGVALTLFHSHPAPAESLLFLGVAVLPDFGFAGLSSVELSMEKTATASHMASESSRRRRPVRVAVFCHVRGILS